MLVLRPKNGPPPHCCRMDEAFCEGEGMACRLHGQRGIKTDNMASLHDADDMQGVVLATFQKYFF